MTTYSAKQILEQGLIPTIESNISWTPGEVPKTMEMISRYSSPELGKGFLFAVKSEEKTAARVTSTHYDGFYVKNDMTHEDGTRMGEEYTCKLVGDFLKKSIKFQAIAVEQFLTKNYKEVQPLDFTQHTTESGLFAKANGFFIPTSFQRNGIGVDVVCFTNDSKTKVKLGKAEYKRCVQVTILADATTYVSLF